MFTEGQLVKVENPHGTGWITAKFAEVAPDHPTWIEQRGVNPEGDPPGGYWRDQAWVIYQEGDLVGTSGLHRVDKIRPADYAPE